MKTDSFVFLMQLVVFFAIVVLSIGFSEAVAGGKIGLYGMYMEPQGADAEDYSQAGWGGGAHVVVPAPQLSNMLVGVAGFEVINLLSETVELRDETGWRRELQTSQNYARIFIGPQMGAHGKGFFRPHAGLNLA